MTKKIIVSYRAHCIRSSTCSSCDSESLQISLATDRQNIEEYPDLFTDKIRNEEAKVEQLDERVRASTADKLAKACMRPHRCLRCGKFDDKLISLLSENYTQYSDFVSKQKKWILIRLVTSFFLVFAIVFLLIWMGLSVLKIEGVSLTGIHFAIAILIGLGMASFEAFKTRREWIVLGSLEYDRYCHEINTPEHTSQWLSNLEQHNWMLKRLIDPEYKLGKVEAWPYDGSYTSIWKHFPRVLEFQQPWIYDQSWFLDLRRDSTEQLKEAVFEKIM